MKILTRWFRKENYDDLADLEAYLEATLNPITPRPAFVNSLGIRLMEATFSEPSVPQYVFLAVAGVISGIIIVVTGIRAAITILGALGIVRSLKGQIRQERAGPQPVL